MDKQLPERKATRLEGFDYNSVGAYFITICTEDRKQILSRIVGGGALDAPKIILTDTGKIVEKYILSTNKIRGLSVDRYVIMPNHIHIMLRISEKNGTSRAPSPTVNNVISHAVSTLKRFVNRDIGQNIFQRSFYDHVIRDGADYDRHIKYIFENPIGWYYSIIK